jgi:hypothetical protein
MVFVDPKCLFKREQHDETPFKKVYAYGNGEFDQGF